MWFRYTPVKLEALALTPVEILVATDQELQRTRRISLARGSSTTSAMLAMVTWARRSVNADTRRNLPLSNYIMHV